MAKKIIIFCFIILALGIFFGAKAKALNSVKSYARGYINWYIQRKWIGAKVSFANPNPDYIAPPSSDPNKGPVNQTLGVITNNGNLVYDSETHEQTQSWVEVGYTKGWATNRRDPNTYNPDIRSLYTARERPLDGIGYYDERLSPISVGPPGTVHNYKILYDSGVWKVYIDGIYDSYSSQPLYAQTIAIGLENADSKNSSVSEVSLQNMAYYYENQGWYSFGQANPKIQITSPDGGNYYFYYTNSTKDTAKDGMNK